MDPRARSAAVGGALLILLGAVLLFLQISPAISAQFQLEWSWPLIVILVGVGLFVMGLLTGAPGMAIPACIVAGIGGILYWQVATGDWVSWAYAWTLIPGFVGIGMIIAALLGEGGTQQIWKGAETILTSLVLFVIFATLFGGMNVLGVYWPLLLVLVGAVQLVRRVFRPFPSADLPAPGQEAS
jgi:hypothetical protein